MKENRMRMKTKSKVTLQRPGLNFINVLRTAFTCVIPKSVKRLTTSPSFYAFELRVCKSFAKNIDEIDTRILGYSRRLGIITLMKLTPGYLGTQEGWASYVSIAN